MGKGLLIAVMFLTIFFASFPAETKQVLSLENGNLVISEVKMVIPGVPAGISAETAYKLVTGEIKEWKVMAEEGETRYLSLFPIIERRIFADRLIKYKERLWSEETIVRVEEEENKLVTFFFIVLPVLGILIVTLKNQLADLESRRLLLFNAAMIVSILVSRLVGALVNWLMDAIAAGGAGMFIGYSIGMLAGMFAGRSKDEVFPLASFIGGVLVGIFTGAFAGAGGYGILGVYLVFVIIAMVVSFLIAQIVRIAIFISKTLFQESKTT